MRAWLGRIVSSREQKLANDEFEARYPGDQDAVTKAFVAFTGLFGQVLLAYRVRDRSRPANIFRGLEGVLGEHGVNSYQKNLIQRDL